MEERIEMISSWPPATNEDQDSHSEDEREHNSHCRTQCSVTSSTGNTNTGMEGNTYPQDDVLIMKRKALTCTSIEKAKKTKRVQYHDYECMANVFLARWWKHSGRKALSTSVNMVQSCNPETMLKQIVRLPETKEVLEAEIIRLLEKVQHGFHNDSNTVAALGSFYEKLKHYDKAEDYLMMASNLEPGNKEYCWFQERVKKNKMIRSIQRQRKTNKEGFSDTTLKQKNLQSTVPVEKRSCKDLSVKEFFSQYALTSKPVIITGLVSQMTSQPWTLQHVKQVAGDCNVRVRRVVPESVEWAQLEEAETTTVADFISGLTEQCDRPLQDRRYMFDWSLPLHGPQLLNELTIPAYFAGDFLQRTEAGSLYHDSWPSLFVAPAGLHSELHVDAFGSNFWMALFEGRKRWTFFDKEDVPLLYPEYESSMDPVFSVDLTAPDFAAHPLLSLSTPRQCVLEAGELLFVPAGCPHRVENLTTSLAISANFVDISNFALVKKELRINSLIDDRAADLLQQFTNPSFSDQMDYDAKHLAWKDFKIKP